MVRQRIEKRTKFILVNIDRAVSLTFHRRILGPAGPESKKCACLLHLENNSRFHHGCVTLFHLLRVYDGTHVVYYDRNARFVESYYSWVTSAGVVRANITTPGVRGLILGVIVNKAALTGSSFLSGSFVVAFQQLLSSQVHPSDVVGVWFFRRTCVYSNVLICAV